MYIFASYDWEHSIRESNVQKKRPDNPSINDVATFKKLKKWNNTGTPYPKELTLTQLFENTLINVKENHAIICNHKICSYHALQEKIESFVGILAQYGMTANDRVAFLLDRSEEMLTCMLAVLKMGGTYIPIDVTYPETRIAHILQNARVSLVVTQSKNIKNIKEEEALGAVQIININELWNKGNLLKAKVHESTTTAQDLAYIIYTSGSTGTPKGVAVTHQNINNYIQWFNHSFRITSQSRIDFSSSIAFDFSVSCTLAPLLGGACIVICQEEVKHSPIDYLHYLKRYCITHVKWTPSYFNTLLNYPQLISKLCDLKWIILGGEPLSVNDIKSWLSINPIASIVNEYGPTEATVATIAHRVTAHNVHQYSHSIPIGKPADNTQIYIVDKNEKLCPINIPGELWIAGDSVAIGYFDNPELTSNRFFSNPFDEQNTSRIYKTGDLACWLENGEIEYLGRIDNQVKIRGFRIELGEIESVLKGHSAIQNAVVLPWKRNLTTSLIGYLVPCDKTIPLNTIEINQFLRSKLPEYMIPSLFMQVDKIPLNTNGKIDANALPGPTELNKKISIKPKSTLEKNFLKVISKVLKIPTDQICMSDSFYSLGGDSLLAMQVIAKYESQYKKRILIRDLLEATSIENICVRIKEIKTEQVKISIQSNLSSKNRMHHPLSFAQQRIWFLNQLEPEGANYNVFIALELEGMLCVDALQKAFRSLIARHQSLRTLFLSQADGPYQQIKSTIDIDFKFDINHQMDIPIDTIQSIAHREAQIPFELNKAPLLRLRLCRHKKDIHYLFICIHHIIVDGWSIHILLTELAHFYNAACVNAPSQLKALPFEYTDYVNWQTHFLSYHKLDALLSYWNTQLKDSPTLLLPFEKGNTDQKSHKGKHFAFSLNENILSDLKDFSLRSNATLFTVLLTGFFILLARYTQQDDIVIGTPIAGRTSEELECIVGFFVNLLALRCNLKNSPSVSELICRNKLMTIEAYEHQDCPFEKVVELLNPIREIARNPICPIVFVFQNYPHPLPQFTGLKSKRAFSENNSVLFSDFDNSKFDLTLLLQEDEHHLEGIIEFNSNKYNDSSMLNLIKHYQNVLESMMEMPDRNVWDLAFFSKEQLYFPPSMINPDINDSLIGRFEKQCTKSSEHLALIFKNEKMTYRVLNQRATQLASVLQTHGISKGHVVAICMQCGIDVIISLLGILKIGGVYLAIDDKYPRQRIDFMLKNSDTKCLITQDNYLSLFSDFMLEDRVILKWEQDIKPSFTDKVIINKTIPTNAESVAYIVFTSGTSGLPKGIAVNNSTLLNLVSWQSKCMEKGVLNIAQFASFGFDVFLQEVFSALLNGATLSIIPPEIKHSIHELLTYLSQQQIHQLFIPTVLLDLIAKEALFMGISFPYLKEIIVAGEQLVISPRIRDFFTKNKTITLLNHYGPSETHVVTSYTMPQDASQWTDLPPIGKPIHNTAIYVLDNNRHLMPLGITGEIYIGGLNLAQGYVNNPELTREKFIYYDIEPGRTIRLYKTGDLGYFDDEGQIHCVGRMDGQIKIRGFRIESGEIESVVTQYKDIEQACVVVTCNNLGDKELNVYMTLQNKDSDLDINSLRAFLKERLPVYMLPKNYGVLDTFPLTTHGKINKAEIVKYEKSVFIPKAFNSESESQLYSSLKTLIAPFLNMNPRDISTLDNLFDIGLHSLLIVQVVTQLNNFFNTKIQAKDLYENPTLELLGSVVERLIANNTTNTHCIVRLKNQGSSTTLFIIHPILGNINSFRLLSKKLEINMNIDAILDPSFEQQQCLFTSITDMARYYIKNIIQVQNTGPYYIGGYSMGGVIAIEVARKLQTMGHHIAWVGLFDSWALSENTADLFTMAKIRFEHQITALAEQIQLSTQDKAFLEKLYAHHMRLLKMHKLHSFSFPIHLFKAQQYLSDINEPYNYWNDYARGSCYLYHVSGSHDTMLSESNVSSLAQALQNSLNIKQFDFV